MLTPQFPAGDTPTPRRIRHKGCFIDGVEDSSANDAKTRFLTNQRGDFDSVRRLPKKGVLPPQQFSRAMMGAYDCRRVYGETSF
jgi:hypothetical protein